MWCGCSALQPLLLTLFLHVLNMQISHWNASVSVVNKLLAGQPRNGAFITCRDKKLFCKPSRLTLQPTQSPTKSVPVLFPRGGVKWPFSKADHTPLSSAEVKNEESYTSTPPYILMACTRTTLSLPPQQQGLYTQGNFELLNSEHRYQLKV